jgi:hypothetical protein
MSEKERKGYHIAKSHLKQSFQLEKSNQFLKWVKEQKEKAANPPPIPTE